MAFFITEVTPKMPKELTKDMKHKRYLLPVSPSQNLELQSQSRDKFYNREIQVNHSDYAIHSLYIPSLKINPNSNKEAF